MTWQQRASMNETETRHANETAHLTIVMTGWRPASHPATKQDLVHMLVNACLSILPEHTRSTIQRIAEPHQCHTGQVVIPGRHTMTTGYENDGYYCMVWQWWCGKWVCGRLKSRFPWRQHGHTKNMILPKWALTLHLRLPMQIVHIWRCVHAHLSIATSSGNFVNFSIRGCWPSKYLHAMLW
jgi:hypothetical protein